ncbi:MAG: hypothetical protein H6706_12970 [Myxococcales bacterium]|nr:hypothetical protein [Myxococcales bacterium]
MAPAPAGAAAPAARAAAAPRRGRPGGPSAALWCAGTVLRVEPDVTLDAAPAGEGGAGPGPLGPAGRSHLDFACGDGL